MYARHFTRPWQHRSYRVCLAGVAGTADIQAATATGTLMRILENSTYDVHAALSIAKELIEMRDGADYGNKQVLNAFDRLQLSSHGKKQKAERYMRLRRFYFRYGKLVRFLYDGGSRNCAQVRLGDQHRERIGRKQRHSQYLTSRGTHTDPQQRSTTVRGEKPSRLRRVTNT